jgi:hypothetical protein
MAHRWLWLGQIACQDARWRPGREVLRPRAGEFYDVTQPHDAPFAVSLAMASDSSRAAILTATI